MKSYIFSTDNDRGGVMLGDVDTLEDAVEYLHKRFPGVIKVEMNKDYWSLEEGYVKAPEPE
ncbi:MAG: hypothetical protein ACPG4U_03345 [Pseudomonadales bacterium]